MQLLIFAIALGWGLTGCVERFSHPDRVGTARSHLTDAEYAAELMTDLPVWVRTNEFSGYSTGLFTASDVAAYAYAASELAGMSKADVRAGLDGGQQLDDVAVAAGVLLDDHGVGPRRERGAGEDAQGGLGGQGLGPRRAGGDLAHHRQAAAGGTVGRADGVAIHGRVVEGRQGAGGHDGLGQHAVDGLLEGQAHRPQRRDAIQDDRAGVGHGEEGGAHGM